MPVILEPEELELVAHRARPGYPGLGRQLTKRRRDSTRAVMGRASAPPLGRKPQRLSRRSILWCVFLQVIMTIANTPAPKEAITAALLVIGDKTYPAAPRTKTSA